MPRLQKALVFALLAILALPLPLTGLFRLISPRGAWANWWMNRSLGGVTIPTHSAPLSTSTWFSATFQQSVTAWVNENFAGRELAIRTCNHVLWTLFARPTSKKGIIIRGPDGNLFEEGYLHHFHTHRNVDPTNRLQTVADQLKDIQDQLARRRIAFSVLFTPSKATCLPDSVPRRYRDGVPVNAVRNYDVLLGQLRARGVNVVDGACVTREIASSLPGPTFPKTGTHWFRVAAFFTAEALLREIERQKGVPLARLELGPVSVSDVPNTTDTDIASMLNLLEMPVGRYLHAVTRRPADSVSQKGRLAIVGGSFVHYLTDIWDATQAWESINHYYYYKLGVVTYPGGDRWRPKPHTVDWSRDFLTVDAVVVEMNENVIAGPHTMAFLEGALVALTRLEGPSEVELTFAGNAWYREEGDETRRWRWTRGTAELNLTNFAPENRPVTVQADLTSSVLARQVSILDQNGTILWTGECAPHRWSYAREIRIDVPPGTTRLRFETDLPAQRGTGGDTRELAFGVFNLRVGAAPPVPTPE